VTVAALDLFAGAGGFSLGLDAAGIRVEAANEIDPDSCGTFRRNHPSVSLMEGDVKDVDFREWKGIDLVCGGPPCQGFSTLGKKREGDFRNSLYMQFVRALGETECRAFCFENVSGFCGLYGGAIFSSFMRRAQDLGFSVFPLLVDASDYGVPQHRKRTIILGAKRIPRGLRFAERGDSPPARVSLMDAISDLPALSNGEAKENYGALPENPYQSRMRDGSDAVTHHDCSNYGEKMRRILSLIPEGGCISDLPKGLRPASAFSNTYARLLPDVPSPTITRNFGTPSSSRCVHPHQDRALSTREGARLQSFPDSYCFCGSRSSRNLQIGNAVPPMLGEVLGGWARQILSHSRKAMPRRKPGRKLTPAAYKRIDFRPNLRKA